MPAANIKRQKQRRCQRSRRDPRACGQPNLPADNFERNVGISQIRAEQNANGIADDKGQDEPDSRVVAAGANAKGRLMLLRLLPQGGECLQWNLEIAIDQKHVLPGGNIEPSSQRLAVPSIGLMYHSQPRLRSGEAVQYPPGVVPAAIINYDQFVIGDQ